VRIEPGTEHALLVRSLHDPNPKLFELLLAAAALRDCGAPSVSLVSPYLPYMRQDRAFVRGEAVSQRVLGGLLGGAFERVICIEPHLHRIASLSEVFPCDTIAVSAAPAIARWLAAQSEPCWVVGPDEESEGWVRAIGEAAKLPHVVATKRRVGDDAVLVRLPDHARAPLPRAVVVDDIASSGATLAAAARALYEAGAQRVDAVVAHAIIAPGAEARIRAARIGRLVSCDTLPHPTNAIDTAGLIADALLLGPVAHAV
jgi:ribose-phosphate pyrophosphokinase